MHVPRGDDLVVVGSRAGTAATPNCWSLAPAVYPGFDSYQGYTDRQIPVAVLERGDEA